MIDIHTHILPQIDDGAKSPSMSIEMLKNSKIQGVDTIVATPHCCPKSESDIDVFIKRREKSYTILNEYIKNIDNIPDIKLGCELKIETDFSDFKNIDKLCIEDTNYILVELPYSQWKPYIYDVLYNLIIHNFRPIIAHIDRFYTHKKDFKNLLELDLIYQVNADAFISKKIRKIMPYYFKNNMINIIGSDMHNIYNRPQRINEAYKIINKYYGNQCVYYFKRNAENIINNKSINALTFKKKNIFTRLIKHNTI